MLKIGDFSKLTCISVRMLRYYDKHEVLKPKFIDDKTGYRFYESHQLEQASLILKLRSLDFSISEIKDILSDTSPKSIDSYFNRKRKEIEYKLEYFSNVEKEINQIINDDCKDITYNVLKKEISPRKVASYRNTIKNYMCEKELWLVLVSELEELKIDIVNDGYAVAIFHDLEYKEESVDVEVQVTVDKTYENTEHITFYETDKVTVASVIFSGSYNKMSKVTYSAINWIELNNYELLQPTFNIYHISPAQDNNPDNWITESCFILKEGND